MSFDPVRAFVSTKTVCLSIGRVRAFWRTSNLQVEEDQLLIELSRLRAYAPELNRVERCFQELKRRMKFRVFDLLEAAEKCVNQALAELM